MSRTRISLYALGGMTAVLAIAIVVVLSVDFGLFKNRIESVVSDQLGREFRIAGDLNIRVGSSVDIYAEDIFLTNPNWADNEMFFAARKVNLVVEFWSLLTGPVRISRLDVDGIRVNLEANPDGETSWDFAAVAPVPIDDGAEDSVDSQLPLVLTSATITDAYVTYRSAALREPIVFFSESLTSSSESDYQRFEIDGSINGTPLRVVMTGGPLQNLLDHTDVKVDIAGNIGEIRFSGSSKIDKLFAPVRPQLTFDIEGPDASYLTDILALQPVNVGPLQLSILVEDSGEYMTASFVGAFGEFDFDVSGQFKNLQALQDIEIDFDVDGPEIGTLMRLAGREYAAHDAFDIRGRMHRSGAEVTVDNVLLNIGDNRLAIDGFFGEFPTPKGGRLSIEASGPEFGHFNRLFGMPGRLGGAYTVSFNLIPNGDGRARINLSAQSPDIDIQLNSLLTLANNFQSTTLDLEVSGPNIGALVGTTGFGELPADEFQLSAALEKDANGLVIKNLELVSDGDVFKLSGHVADEPLSGSTRLQLDFSGSNLGSSILASNSSSDRLPGGEYFLRGAVESQGNRLYLRDLQAAIGPEGEYRFQLDGFLNWRDDFVGSEVSVQAHGDSTAALAELAGQQDVPDLPFDLSATFRRGQSKTFIEAGVYKSALAAIEFDGHVGDEPLQQDFALTFRASAPDFRNVASRFTSQANLLPDDNFTVNGDVYRENGKISVDQFDVSLAGAELSVKGDVGRWPTFTDTRLLFDLSGQDLSAFAITGLARELSANHFSASGTMLVSDAVLAVDALHFSLGNFTLNGDVELSLDPFLANGKFNATADSPDIFQLLPSTQSPSFNQSAVLEYSGSGEWADNYWKFDHSILQIGEGQLKISGSLDGPPSFERSDLRVEWNSPSIRNLSLIVGQELPDQALAFKARLVGTKEVMRTEAFELTVGESDLSGQLTLRDGEIPKIEIALQSQVLDIAEFIADPDEAARDSGASSDERVIPDVLLPLDFLRIVDMDMDIDISELRTRSERFSGIALDASIVDGSLRVENFFYESPRGGFLKLAADLIPNASNGADLSLEVDAENLVLAFQAKTADDISRLPLMDVAIKLTAHGTTVRDLAGSLDGYVRIVGGPGQRPPSAYSFIANDFVTELVSKINPLAQGDAYTVVECAVVLLQIDEGEIRGNPAFVQQTNKLRIFANTRIDLGTEELDVDFEIIPQKGLGLSFTSLVNPYVKLTGTLANPSLTMDTKGVIVQGGAAVATAGLSLLAKTVKDRFLAEKDPCGKALSEADALWAERYDMEP